MPPIGLILKSHSAFVYLPLYCPAVCIQPKSYLTIKGIVITALAGAVMTVFEGLLET